MKGHPITRYFLFFTFLDKFFYQVSSELLIRFFCHLLAERKLFCSRNLGVLIHIRREKGCLSIKPNERGKRAKRKNERENKEKQRRFCDAILEIRCVSGLCFSSMKKFGVPGLKPSNYQSQLEQWSFKIKST